MAEMILGRVEVVAPTADFSKEFVAWFADNRGKWKGTTAEKYLGYFKTLTAACQEPTHSYWHGLYRVMYGKDAEKDVAAIGALEEFERIYGGVITALEQKVMGEGMTDDGFAKAVAWFWSPEVKPHTYVTSALKLFQEARKATVSTDVRYWIFSPGKQACRWDEMREGDVMSLSYEECGRDLREYADEEAIRAESKSSEEDEASYKNHGRALTDFLNVMKPGDLVFAKKGTKTFLGVGRVTGEYEFAAADRAYVERVGMETIRRHAEDFVRMKLAPAEPEKDGRQTPMRSDPVFMCAWAENERVMCGIQRSGCRHGGDRAALVAERFLLGADALLEVSWGELQVESGHPSHKDVALISTDYKSLVFRTSRP